jgi:hypothetical protein
MRKLFLQFVSMAVFALGLTCGFTAIGFIQVSGNGAQSVSVYHDGSSFAVHWVSLWALMVFVWVLWGMCQCWGAKDVVNSSKNL